MEDCYCLVNFSYVKGEKIGNPYAVSAEWFTADDGKTRCSNCLREKYFHDDYCDNCGAEMKGVDAE